MHILQRYMSTEENNYLVLYYNYTHKGKNTCSVVFVFVRKIVEILEM